MEKFIHPFQKKDHNNSTVTCALIVKNLVDIQYLRLLVVLQHSVGVEGGGIVHLLHIWTWLLTLREMKVQRKTFISLPEAPRGPNSLMQTFGNVYDHQQICLHLRVKSRRAHGDTEKSGDADQRQPSFDLNNIHP